MSPSLRASLAVLVIVALAGCQSAEAVHGLESGREVDVAGLLELASAVNRLEPEPLGWLDDEYWLEFGLWDGAPEGAEEQLLRVDARSGARAPLYDAHAMQDALAALEELDENAAGRLARRRRYEWLPKHAGMLLRHADALFVYRIAEEQALRITSPGEIVGESLSPDGEWVGFVRDNDILVASTRELSEKRLTFDGTPNLLNGRLDWVYQEEIYGRGDFNGFWWSPDSTRIAFLQLDESPVGEFFVEDHIPTRGAREIWRYPKAGDPNPRVRVGCLALSGGEPAWMDLDDRPQDDRLVLQVDWKPDGSAVVLQMANRIQNETDLRFCDPETGARRLVLQERSDSWVRRWPLTWMPDGRLLFLSDRSGWRQLYRMNPDDGEVTALTAGEFDVLSVTAVTSDGSAAYVMSNESGILERHLWRVELDPARRATGQGVRTRITAGRGTHAVRLSPGSKRALDTWSNAADPGGRDLLALPSGEIVRPLGRRDRARLAEAGYRPPEFFQVPNRNGFLMEAMLYAPADFDPQHRYPVLVYTYGGPGAPSVRDRFGGFRALWHSALTDLGCLVFVCDNESASGKGAQAAAAMYRRAGETELRDLEDAVAWLVARGSADPARVGIWGWSYGGFMTAYALTHSQVFRMGIAGAPVTDWRNYDTVYTERYMGTPELNPEGYAASSVLEAAADLHGDLLLLHGTIDENVHLANTLQLALRLQKAGKLFQMMLYPRNRHGVRDPEQREHLYRLMTEFIREHL